MQAKVLMVFPPMDFRDEELFIPRSIFESNGIHVTLASSVDPSVVCYGMLKGRVHPDLHIKNVTVGAFDAFVFVGGLGVSYIWDDPLVLKIIFDAFTLKKIVAAISTAPILFANAGIVNNKRVTVWKSDENKLLVRGAFCTGNRVEYDMNIITANSTECAEQFARSIIKGLKGVV